MIMIFHDIYFFIAIENLQKKLHESHSEYK